VNILSVLIAEPGGKMLFGKITQIRSENAKISIKNCVEAVNWIEMDQNRVQCQTCRTTGASFRFMTRISRETEYFF
jgi:hypothetical protein